MLYAGGMRDVAARVWRDLASADPTLKLFAPSALADASFAALVGSAGVETYATRPLLPLGAYPPSARRFARRFTERYGDPPLPEALYGYEAMRAALAAIRSAERIAGGALSRRDVVQALFDQGRRESVLGPYRIDAHGDTSLREWGGYRLTDDRLQFDRALRD